MKLHDSTNYAEWSISLIAELSKFDLMPVVDGTFPAPPTPSPDGSKTELEKSIDYANRNTHARNLIIDFLSDSVYDTLFKGEEVKPELLTSAKALWDELRQQYQERDIVSRYLSLYRTLSTQWTKSTPLEVHIQSFVRSMKHLNELAEGHAMEPVPEWMQIAMMLGSIEGVDKGIQEHAVEVLGKTQMKKLSKLKMKDLASDMVDGGRWVEVQRLRRRGGSGVKAEGVEGKA